MRCVTNIGSMGAAACLTFARWPQLQIAFSLGWYVEAYDLTYRNGMSFSQAGAPPFWFPDSVWLRLILSGAV
ncbi:hypothetical protein AYO41_05295 [Verrucomicrobia bacterium SCGC AG-212-E04]|nr:hypothetical protein AYO41_05295 [Verrucomicrobia bacterium SCGC AG-212-E04]